MKARMRRAPEPQQPSTTSVAMARERVRGERDRNVEQISAPSEEELDPRTVGLYAADRLLVGLRSRNLSVDEGLRALLVNVDGQVVGDVRSFIQQLDYHAKRDLEMPTVQGRELPPVPVDLSSMIGPFWRTDLYADREAARLLKRARTQIEEAAERSRLDVAMVPPASNLTFFRHGLSRFLGSHLKARIDGAWTPPPQAPPIFVPNFTVHTRRKRLRVVASPAYWRDIRRTFVEPTTPSHDWLPDGIWTFGAEGDRFPLTWDEAEYEVPRQGSATLLGI